MYNHLSSLLFHYLTGTSQLDITFQGTSNAGGVGSIPGWGAEILHASWPKKTKHKTSDIVTNSVKT